MVDEVKYMTKLEELRNHVAELFKNATEPDIIKQSAVVEQKIKEAEEEQTKLQTDYTKLLGDYKDVVLHTSFKPNSADTGNGVPGAFDPDAAFNQFFTDTNKN